MGVKSGYRDPIDARYVPSHGDTRFDVVRYELDLIYAPDSNRLQGTARLTARAVVDLDSFVLDLSSRLRVAKVAISGRRSAYRHKNHHLTVRPKSTISAGEEFEVRVSYSGDPQPLSGLDGDAGWEELEDGSIVASQPHGAPSFFPCNDRPSSKATYAIAVSVPTGYTALANGVAQRPRRSAGGTTFRFDQDEPMATYLVSVHVGRLVIDSDDVHQGHQDLPVRVVASATWADRAQKALRDQPAMVEFFTERFGPYPFRAGYTTIVTDDELEIPIEAQAMSIFGSNFMTDDWEAQRLVAHELSHQWFGNSLTLRHWNDIWLHEGFACYSEWLWSEQVGQRSAHAWAQHHHGQLAKGPQDLLLADPGPDDMFDDRVYKRGALTLHSLRLRIGDDAFFDLLRAWTDRHRHGHVQTADLEALISQLCGFDGAEFLDPWLRQTALPDLPPAL